MPPLAGYWHSLLTKHARVWKAALKEVSKQIEAKVASRVEAQLEPVLVRNAPRRQPLHPAARLRQSQSRWFSTRRAIDSAVRQFTSSSAIQKPTTRASFPRSNVGDAVRSSTGRAPFASTLRPNLTGGTLGRTAGGYSLGGAGRVGGARYFSHGPAVQAQVVQNASQAMRAFMIGGHKAQFNGISPLTGEKQYKSVTALQEETSRKMQSLPKATPGSYVNFSVNPTITALTPLNAIAGYTMAHQSQSEPEHLNTNGLLDVLAVDFSRVLKDLAAMLNDLKRLSALGDLPITYQDSSLRVHFPGCDADTVENLCSELNVHRGTVVQDEDFDAFVGTDMALLFPFAPSSPVSEADDLFEKPGAKAAIDWRNMLAHSDAQKAYSTQSDTGFEDIETPLDSSPSGYESLEYDSASDKVSTHSPLEYQGFEGILRFIEQCDSAGRR